VFDPDILLMDEPLGALDRSLRQQIQGELKALQRRLGVTVLYVTHDQEEALDLSDTIAVMRDGRIEQAGSPQALYDHPTTRFVAGFLGECNILPAQVQPGGREIVVEIGEGLGLPWSGGGSAGGIAVGLRPERVRIVAAGERGAIAGVLRAVVFTGADFRLTVEAGGRLLTARHANRDFNPPAVRAARLPSSSTPTPAP
jgi:ABC-type Fe3+/spermidine/putrescine transport system ATPase subunit